MNKCCYCGKKLKSINKLTEKDCIIKVEFSHSITDKYGTMWDDIGYFYICSFECYKKLTNDENKDLPFQCKKCGEVKEVEE